MLDFMKRGGMGDHFYEVVSHSINREVYRKVPEITVLFWVIKLLSTAMGESTSDYLVHQFDPILVVFIAGVGLFLSLLLQFWVKKYIAWVYWLAVIMVAIFGTMAADVVHIILHVPYIISSIAFFILLIAIFMFWFLSEKTLSIHSIVTTKREIFYWLTVMATFALGTAVGDLSASTFQLGYFVSGIIFSIGIFLSFTLYRVKLLKEVPAFWIAYIITRPLGASFADWFGKSTSIGVLEYGDGSVSLILCILIIFFVVYISITHVAIGRDKV